MTSERRWRAWAPGLGLLVLAGGWYIANVAAYAASFRTQRAAEAKITAIGHPPVFQNLPSAWDWNVQTGLRMQLLGIIGAAVIAMLVRRSSRLPWFALLAVLPILVGHTYRTHGWWAPGAGIDQWTWGAGVAVPGLNLSDYGAGPWWTVPSATVLAVAAVFVPALLLRPTPAAEHRRYVTRAVPYVALLAVGSALGAGLLNVDDSGAGASGEMLVAAAAAFGFGTAAAFIAADRWFWRDALVLATAAGLVTVSGLNPGAMSATKWAAFAAAAGVAIVASCAARRPKIHLSASHSSAGDQGAPVVG